MKNADYARAIEASERAAIDRALETIPTFVEMAGNVPGPYLARTAILLLDIGPQIYRLPRQWHPFRRRGGEHVKA